jgi:hypothetical protein
MTARWTWALLLVGCIHVLSTPGTWQVTDHAESLYTARRLLDHGTLTLADAGTQRIEALPWAAGRPGEPIRSRLSPLPAVALVPFLWADRQLGWEDPVDYGRLVHVHGHVFVLAGLALLGSTLLRSGASAGAAAVAVAAVGLSWPVWQVSRRGGPESLLFVFVSLFVAAEFEAPTRRTRLLQALVCLFVPWAHATGALLSVALAAGAFCEPLRGRGLLGALSQVRLPAAGALAGGSGLLVWNHLYHGSWWAGGYAAYAPESYFAAVNPLAGLWVHVFGIAVQAPAPILLAWAGARASGGWRTAGLALPLALSAVLVMLFATFYAPEPARRLAAIWPAWGLVVGGTWDRLRWRTPAPQIVLAAAGVLGFYWFMAYEGRYYPGPGGLFYPSVRWLKLAIDGEPVWRTAAPAGLLFGLACLAAARTWRLLREAHAPASAAAVPS